MKKQFEINKQELTKLTVELCKMGEELGHEPDEFAVMLTMAAKDLCDAQGIEITSERNLHS